MKGREVGYVLLALIILGVAGVIVKLVTTGNNDQTLTGLLPLHSDVIDEVTIRTTEFGPDSTEGTAKLSRLGEDWSIKTESGSQIAFQPYLDRMWEMISRFEGAQLISTNPHSHKKMLIDDQAGIEVIFMLGASVQEKFTIGSDWSSDIRHCFIRRAGNDYVYTVPCQYENIFNPSSNGWRNPVIVSIAREEINLVTIRYPKQNNEFFSIDLNGQTNGVWTPFLVLTEGNEYANPYTADTLLRAVNGLVASDFASKEEIDAINFDIPDASILIKTRDGSQIPTQRVLFVKNSDGTYYVKNTNKADVFKLESDVIETFVLPLDSYIFPEETLP
jgi:hypothetical protein